MAAALYQRENERQLDFGHMKQIAADMTGQEDTSTFAGAWAPVGNLEINSGHDGNGWREIYFAGND